MIGLLLLLSIVSGDTIPTIDEIIVTAKAEPMAILSSTMEIPDSILKNVITPDKALQELSGIYISYGAKIGADVMIRGFDTREITILIDGVPVSLPYDGTFDISQIPVSDLMKIRVYKGVGANIFGPNAMGGAINFVTASPFSGKRQISLGVGRNFDKYASFTYSVNSGNLGLLVTGSYVKSDGFYLSSKFTPDLNEDGGVRSHSWYDKANLRVKLGYNTFNKGTFYLNTGIIDNSRGIPPEVGSTWPRYWKFPVWREKILKLSHEYGWANKLLRTNFYYQGFYNVLESYRDSTYQNLKWKSTYDDYTIGSNIYFDASNFTSSLLLKKDVHREQGDTGEPWEKYEDFNGSLAGNYLVNLGKVNFSVGLGASFLKPYELGEAQKTLYALDPSVGVTWAIGNLRFKTSVAMRSRFPTLKELYSSRLGRYIPNPDLKAERSLNIDAGVTYVFGNLEGSLTFFDSEVKDLIDRIKVDSIHYQMVNINKARYYGFELDLKAYCFKFNYTFLKALNLSPDREFDYLEYRPEHKFNVEFQKAFVKGVKFDMTVQYVGSRYYIERSGTGELPSYTLTNLSLEKTFGRYGVSFKVDNLFDVNYESEKGDPMPGRYYRFDITINLD